MKKLDELLDSVVLEGQFISTVKDAAEYNFMPGANKVMRKAEITYGDRCIEPLIERISDRSLDGPAIRIFLSSLMRLSPTRQAIYEQNLSEILPGWKTALEGNPQIALPEEFHIASEKSLKNSIKFPKGLFESVEIALKSYFPDVVISALKFLERAGDKESIDIVRKTMSSSDQDIRVASILTAARLSTLDSKSNNDIANIMTDNGYNVTERRAAAEALLVGSSRAESITEFLRDNIFTLEDSDIFYDVLLDSANEDIQKITMKEISKKLDVISIPNNVFRRLNRIPGISPKIREFSLKTLRRLELDNQELLRENSRFGLIAHRNSDVTGGWVGHCGIFVSENEIIDCSTGRGSNAVQKISFNSWKDGKECWGIREDDDHQVDLKQAVDRAHEINSWRTEYDGMHNNQKGEWFKGWFSSPKYWEADCVGFTEHCYEKAGGNPTPNGFENGAGWPLTVREQRDHMRKVFSC